MARRTRAARPREAAGAALQVVWRTRFVDPTAGSITIAQFVEDFLNGTMQQVGP